MSKVKSSEIPHYELLYLISNKFSEDELAPIAEKISSAIKNNGGNITYSEEWGKKRLAYPIAGFRHGYYNLVEFDLTGENLEKVDRVIRMMSEILRHQVVKKRVKTKEEIERDKKIAEKIAAKNIESDKEQKEKEKDKDKVDLKDLDEKLDKILDTGDLL